MRLHEYKSNLAMYQFKCGGTLTAPSWIITAARCLKNDRGHTLPSELIKVVLGIKSRTQPYSSKLNSIGSTLKDCIPHVKYNPDTSENDIGLIQVRGKISCSKFENMSRAICYSSIVKNLAKLRCL